MCQLTLFHTCLSRTCRVQEKQESGISASISWNLRIRVGVETLGRTMQSFTCFRSVLTVDSYQPVALLQRTRCTHLASVKSAFRSSRHIQLREQRLKTRRRTAGTSTPIFSAKVSLSSVLKLSTSHVRFTQTCTSVQSLLKTT